MLLLVPVRGVDLDSDSKLRTCGCECESPDVKKGSGGRKAGGRRRRRMSVVCSGNNADGVVLVNYVGVEKGRHMYQPDYRSVLFLRAGSRAPQSATERHFFGEHQPQK